MRRLPSSVLPLALQLALLSAAPIASQTTEYIAPGSPGRRPVDAREALRSAVDGAKWNLGPVRLDPWLALDELAWVEPDGEEGDLTASAGVGLRAYLPVGSKTVLAAHALPRYTWWQDRAEDRHWGGEAGLGLFVHSHRLAVEVLAEASDLTEVVTPETDERARFDSESLEARVEVPVGSHLALFARGGTDDLAADTEASNAEEFDELDRTETWLEGGVRWYIRSALSLGLGAGRDEAEFDDAADRSNEGSYQLAELAWQRPKLAVLLAARRVEREAASGSTFEEWDGTDGSARVVWSPRDRFSWGVYALRQIGYPVVVEGSLFVEERFGTTVTLGVGHRTTATLFAEGGEIDYRDGGPVEDVTSLGGSLALPLGRRFKMNLGGRRTVGDRGGVERETLEWRASVGLGELLGRWF